MELNRIRSDILFYILSSRMYCKNKVVEYVKNIYDLDIDYISSFYEIYMKNDSYEKDIYEEFEKQNPLSINTKLHGINRYKKFYKNYKNKTILDYSMICVPYREVHHIFPECYGGSNSLYNLIPVTSFNHKILHENPFEHIEKYCFMAVDYLHYLWSHKLGELIDKYNLQEVSQKESKTFLKDYTISIIKEEMRKFYKHLEETYV